MIDAVASERKERGGGIWHKIYTIEKNDKLWQTQHLVCSLCFSAFCKDITDKSDPRSNHQCEHIDFEDLDLFI